MSLSTLPQPIKAFLQATASRDRAGLLSSFADDAVLIDMGKEHRGEEIAHWGGQPLSRLERPCASAAH